MFRIATSVKLANVPPPPLTVANVMLPAPSVCNTWLAVPSVCGNVYEPAMLTPLSLCRFIVSASNVKPVGLSLCVLLLNVLSQENVINDLIGFLSFILRLTF